MKRAIDIIAAALGLTIFAPLLASIACAIWIEDRHSPFFFGRRIARGGGIFHMVKFRSMVPNAWRSGVSSTSATDRRITYAGSILRRAKLDELPQLWNVLTGDMSLVGPRPQVETDASLYTAEEQRMLAVRPGITDLSSIVFSDEGEILSGSADPDLLYNQIVRPWKSRLALLYVDRRTVLIDLRIILLTLLSAVSRERALAGVARILQEWNADATLLRMAARTQPLIPYAPPGAAEVVERYPAQSAHA